MKFKYNIKLFKATNIRAKVVLWFISGLFLSEAWANQKINNNPRGNIEFYNKAYGLLDLNTMPNVRKVFDKVLSVADKNDKYWPKLAIINDSKTSSIFVLTDGHIVISKKALDTIYKNVSTQHGDARLAFVIGHELAHLASDDFWNNEISSALISLSNQKTLNLNIDKSAERQKKELKADDFGFLYAAIAGYPVDKLLKSNSQKDDFLTFWTKEVNSKGDLNYPEPKYRSDLLRLRLAEKLESIDYFDLGIRLAHFGYYGEAIQLFTKFQKEFPSREVFNNLAFCYLAHAISLMHPNHAYYYWMPIVSDTRTLASKLAIESTSRGFNYDAYVKYNPKIQNLLGNAIIYLNKSIEKDPHYIPAYVNLAIARFYLSFESHLRDDHITQALIAIEKAYQREPQNMEIEAIKTIILAYDQYGQTRYKQAVEQLINKASTSNKTLSLYYNLARLASARPILNMVELEQKYWHKISHEWKALPNFIQKILCNDSTVKKNLKPLPNCPKLTENVIQAPPIQVPIALGRDLMGKPISRKELQQYQLKTKEILNSKIYYSDNLTVLAIDDFITLAVRKYNENKPISIATLTSAYTAQANILPLANGKLFHYGTWAILVQDQIVKEIWLDQNLYINEQAE